MQYYNGFYGTRPDGQRVYFTIQRRTFNGRPYAIYIDGTQSGFNTYINRGACARALKRIRDNITAADPRIIITDLYGTELIRY